MCKQIADHVETMIIYKNTNARFSTNSLSITLFLKFKYHILKVMGGGEVTLAVRPGGVVPEVLSQQPGGVVFCI